jgi:hypothetical protein
VESKTGLPLGLPRRRWAGEKQAHVAQLVEHVLGKDEVTGSIPVMGSLKNSRPAVEKIRRKDEV